MVEIVSSDTDTDSDASFHDKYMVHDQPVCFDSDVDPEEVEPASVGNGDLPLPELSLSSPQAAYSTGDSADYEEFCSGDESDEGTVLGDTPSPYARPDCLDVFMPFVQMEHYNNLAFAHFWPPPASPAFFVRRALQSREFHPSASLRPSSQGAALVCFGSHYEREYALRNSPYIGREHTVYLTRHNETENRFLFDHLNLAALSITDYPLEHWFLTTFSPPLLPMLTLLR